MDFKKTIGRSTGHSAGRLIQNTMDYGYCNSNGISVEEGNDVYYFERNSIGFQMPQYETVFLSGQNESKSSGQAEDRKKSIEDSCRSAYNLQYNYNSEVSFSMSLVVVMCCPKGIVMAADKRSTKLVNGQPMTVNIPVTKVFSFKNFILETWDTNEVCYSGRILPIEDIVNMIVSSDQNISHLDFLKNLREIIGSTKANDGLKYGFVVGYKSQGKYSIAQYSIIDNGLIFNGEWSEGNIRYFGLTQYIPSCININWNTEIGEMKRLCRKIVWSVEEYGRILEDKNIVSSFPVGDGVDTAIFI